MYLCLFCLLCFSYFIFSKASVDILIFVKFYIYFLRLREYFQLNYWVSELYLLTCGWRKKCFCDQNSDKRLRPCWQNCASVSVSVFVTTIATNAWVHVDKIKLTGSTKSRLRSFLGRIAKNNHNKLKLVKNCKIFIF